MSDDIITQARRRTAVVVATATTVALVVVAAVASAVVALGHRDSPGSRQHQPSAAAPGPPAGAADATAAASTPPSGVDEVSWTTVAGATVPVSTVDGPRDTTGGRARGFARTPMGAVHISVRLGPQVGPAVFEPTWAEQVVGDDKVALRERLEADYQSARAQLGVPYGAPAGQLYSTARGYRVTLTGEAADVTLLIEGPDAGGAAALMQLRLQTRWTGTDWALVAPPGGDWATAAQPTTDPTGYTQFPGQG